MDNSVMIGGRFKRWSDARRKFALIKEHLSNGRTVYLSASQRRLMVKPEHIDRIKLTREGIFVLFQGSWLCQTDSKVSVG